jgi:prepilin-type N-terminal cleavage/methylation domain-containing protein
MHLSSKKSFTLMEMLIAVAILAYALCGMLAMYISCFDLISISKNTSIATSAAQGLMEEIRSHTFNDIVSDYDGLNFTVNNMPANRGVVYVNDTDPELLRVTISICWRQKGRVVGEDANLNGIPEATEDVNHNNIIDSPVELISLMVNR